MEQRIAIVADVKDWQLPYQLYSLDRVYLAGFATREARARYMVLKVYTEDETPALSRPEIAHIAERQQRQ